MPSGDGEPHEVLPTVFSFSLYRREGGAPRALTAAELKHITRRLGAGTSTGCYHLGQPVRLEPGGADTPAVLRVAIGAPLVHTVAADSSHGRRLTDRIAWLDARISALAAELHAMLERGLA